MCPVDSHNRHDVFILEVYIQISKDQDMKRITPEEALNYIPLISGDPNLCKKAVAFTLTPCLDKGWEGWENVTYYTNDATPQWQMHPLEAMYDEWKSLDVEGTLENLRENKSE